MSNNLFCWAKKELSQDAVIAYILNRKDDLSKEFINTLLEKDINGNENSNPIEIEIKEYNGIWKQGQKYNDSEKKDEYVPNKTDVFCVFTDHLSKKHALIIEDKVDTELHSHQTIKYVGETVKKGKKEKYDFIHFVMVKTGHYYFWQRDYYNNDSDHILKCKPLDRIEETDDSKWKKLNEYIECIKGYTGQISFHALLLDSY
ncbi:MAG: PD-(D/E)XK nuclease family protein, partial [Erysipelotrichaceae bacterium]|nr:PD-(D/E)XK nuclease family protein [Erysipelotrichaceae bacterium]